MSRHSDNNRSATPSIGFSGLLQLAFIILKLCGVIDWSWWLVLIPLWIDILIIILFIAFIAWLNR